MPSVIHHHLSKSHSYAASLDLARRAALWDYKAPITSKGTVAASQEGEVGALTWDELIRKFTKHNPLRKITLVAVAVDLQIHVLLARAAALEKYDNNRAHLFDEPENGKVLLPPLIKHEDKQVAKQLLDDLDDVLSKKTRASEAEEVAYNSASIVRAFSLYALGSTTSCLAALNMCNLHVPNTQVIADLFEPYDFALLVMGSTIHGLLHERKGSIMTAINYYAATIKVYDACLEHLPSKEDHADELKIWGEHAMYRYALLSRTHCDVAVSLEAHSKYFMRARYWPESFRLAKRGALHRSYMQILLQTARLGSYVPHLERSSEVESEAPPQIASIVNPLLKLHGEPSHPSLAWHTEVSTVEGSYEVILGKTTHFPKAGYANARMLEFCDMIVEAWELGDSRIEDAGEIVDMLYEATLKTFQSQRIMRYLVKMLTALGRYKEANDALALYVKLFSKAKERGLGQEIVSISHLPPERQESGGAVEEQFKEDEDDEMEMKSGVGVDFDSDEQFVEGIIVGLRLLIKFLNDPEQAIKMAELAELAVLEGGLDDKTELRSRLQRMIGIVHSALAEKADRENRPRHQKASLEYLQRAVQLDTKSFENYYHLAYSQAEARQIEGAVISARRAVELYPNSKDGWHLLALLVSAQRDLHMATEVIDAGLEEITRTTAPVSLQPIRTNTNGTGFASLYNESHMRQRTASTDSDDSGHDGYKTPDTFEPMLSPQIISPIQLTNPSSSLTTTAVSSAFHIRFHRSAHHLEFNCDEGDEVESIIRLRITKNVVVESIQGTEAALQDQQSLFMYFSQVSHLIKSKVFVKSEGSGIVGNEDEFPGRPSRIKSLRHHRKGTTDSKSTAGTNSSAKASRVSLHSTASTGAISPTSAVGDEKVDEKQKRMKKKSEEGVTRADAILRDLWLLSAATFRRWGKSHECLGAIQEAERLDSDHAEVWVQYALYCLTIGKVKTATESLTKSLSCSQDYVPAVVQLAKLFKMQGSSDLSEGLLDVLTQTNGWDVSEAWLVLGQIYQSSRRLERSRECLLYALQLEESKPIRPIGLSVPRCL